MSVVVVVLGERLIMAMSIVAALLKGLSPTRNQARKYAYCYHRPKYHVSWPST
jgi:hypothetical protein